MFGEGEAPDWRKYSFDWQAGTPAVFMLAADVSIERVGRAVAGFQSAASEFRARKADLLVLTPPERGQTLRSRHVGENDIQVIDCPTWFFADNAVPMDDVTIVVVDRNVRVALRRSVNDIGQTVAQCLECLDQMVREVPAPVLILQNVLSRDMCRTLIDRFESGDVIEGKVAGVDAAGKPFCRPDYSIKSRKDLQIRRDDPLHPELRRILIDRCGQEIAKAFQVEVAYTDRLMIACYDAPHGWFRRHRDNSSGNVALSDLPGVQRSTI